ncbi:MAG TPA: type IV pilin protein [Steroidobacteraceae bacterium]|nr:type IV pilin protein [Steroidobacteraceae bacterium]
MMQLETTGLNRQRGVTLLELMIVVAVVGIISAIATAGYRQYLIRTNRTDATSQLLRIQVGEEKYFLQNGVYVTDSATMAALVTATPPGLGISTPSPGGFYTLSVAARPGGSATASYQATATAIGSQLADSVTCRTFTIDDQGTRTPADSTRCWR